MNYYQECAVENSFPCKVHIHDFSSFTQLESYLIDKKTDMNMKTVHVTVTLIVDMRSQLLEMLN